MQEELLEKLTAICESFDSLTRQMGEPELLTDHEAFRKVAQERAELEEVVQAFRRYEKTRREIDDSRDILRESSDTEMKELAKEEIAGLETERTELEQRLRRLMIPKDPNNEKNVILEIRAGTGGEEAGLFAADLFRMYLRFAERKSWKVEILEASPTELGGYKEVIAEIRGDRV